MFPYLKSKKSFLSDCKNTECCNEEENKRCKDCSMKSRVVKWLEEYIKRANYLYPVSNSEIRAWCQSVSFYMREVLSDEKIPDNLSVGLEYYRETDMKGDNSEPGVRADMLIGGYYGDKATGYKMKILLIELKQYSKGKIKEGLFRVHNAWDKLVELKTVVGQVTAYRNNIMRSVENKNIPGDADFIELISCVYMHNLEVPKDAELGITEADHVFLKEDKERLVDFICEEFSGTDEAPSNARNVFIKLKSKYRILSSAELADILVCKPDQVIEYRKFLRPDQAFFLSGYDFEGGNIKKKYDNYLEKRLEFLFGSDETEALKKLKNDKNVKLWESITSENERIVDVIEGGPGSGKTLLAMFLLRYCMDFNDAVSEENKIKIAFVYKRLAPVGMLKSLIEEKREEFQKKGVSMEYWEKLDNAKEGAPAYDVIIFDEAHCFNGTDADQLKRLINSSKYTVFFNDSKQKILEEDKGIDEGVLDVDKKERSESAYKELVIPYIENEGVAATDKPNANVFRLWSQFRCNQDEGYLSWVEDLLDMERSTLAFDDDIEFDFDVELIENAADILKVAREEPKLQVVSTNQFDSGYEKDIKIDGKQLFYWRLNPNVDESRKKSMLEVLNPSEVQGLEYDTVLVIIGKDFSEIKQENKATKEIELIKNRYRMLLTRGLKKCYIYCINEEHMGYFRERIDRSRCNF